MSHIVYVLSHLELAHFSMNNQNGGSWRPTFRAVDTHCRLALSYCSPAPISKTQVASVLSPSN